MLNFSLKLKTKTTDMLLKIGHVTPTTPLLGVVCHP